jgi:hypothetical protein
MHAWNEEFSEEIVDLRIFRSLIYSTFYKRCNPGKKLALRNFLKW